MFLVDVANETFENHKAYNIVWIMFLRKLLVNRNRCFWDPCSYSKIVQSSSYAINDDVSVSYVPFAACFQVRCLL